MNARHIVLAVLTVLTLLGAAAPAAAAVPSNDTRQAAQDVTAIPFTITQNTEDATASDSDPADCGTSHRTVWFRHTAKADGHLLATTAGSSYRANITVLEQSGASLTPIACQQGTHPDGPVVLPFPIADGHSYLIVVGQSPYPTPEAWDLKFTLRKQIDVDVDLDKPAFIHDGTRALTVTGVVVCSRSATVSFPVEVMQENEDGTAYGQTNNYLDCTSNPRLFSVRVPIETSTRWHSGPAVVRATARVPADAFSDEEGRKVSLSHCSIIGTLGDDALSGTSGRDLICGLHGADSITTGRGNDVVRAGSGPDIVKLGGGKDSAFGDAGADVIDAGYGDDVVRGGTERDRVHLGSGADRAFGEAGADRISGQAGPDVLYGNRGADRLFGGAQTDRCYGGAEHDTFDSCEQREQ